MLFKEFGGVDAFPLCLSTKDPDEIVATVKAVAPTFGGINLEDISAPRCFEIEDRLKARARHPGLPRRPARHRGRRPRRPAQRRQAHRPPARGPRRADRRPRRRRHRGRQDPARGRRPPHHRLRLQGRAEHRPAPTTRTARCPPIKRWFAESTNAERRQGGPQEVIEGTHLFIGLSGARVMPAEALARMADDAMVFAMANPTPEVAPEEAEPYARIIATGRSDYPNQINNVLCFPGIFRGALDVRAREITEEMKMAAARGIAAVVPENELREDHIIPSPFNRDVPAAVAAAVAEQATREGTAEADPGSVGYAPGDTQEFGAIRRSPGPYHEHEANHRHRRDRPARLAAGRRAPQARRRGDRPQPQQRRRPLGPHGGAGARRGARRPRRRRAPRRRVPRCSAGTMRRSAASGSRARSAPATSSRASRAADPRPAALISAVGRRLLRPPPRPDRRGRPARRRRAGRDLQGLGA